MICDPVFPRRPAPIDRDRALPHLPESVSAPVLSAQLSCRGGDAVLGRGATPRPAGQRPRVWREDYGPAYTGFLLAHAQGRAVVLISPSFHPAHRRDSA